MGGLVKHRKKYVSHKKRWDKQTIVSEEVLVTDYALKNKKEVRKAEFLIAKLKKIAKTLNTSEETKSSAEAQNFIAKLQERGFLKPESNTLDEVLDIGVRDILERRLSNVVYRMKYAKTPSQARQFVVHGHVKVGGKTIDSPSHLITLSDEKLVQFSEFSALFDEEHPERKIQVVEVKEEVVEESSETIEETPQEEVLEETPKSEEAVEEKN